MISVVLNYILNIVIRFTIDFVHSLLDYRPNRPSLNPTTNVNYHNVNDHPFWCLVSNY